MSQLVQQLAIGIPTMDRPDMLQELLSDIKNYQPSVPVVISDNSNGDDTQRLVEHYATSLSINYIRIKDKLSQAENFNVILNSTSTEFIVMMHDDDRFLPNSLENYLSLISYFGHIQKNVIATYVLASKFKDLEKLDRLISSSHQIFSSDDIRNSICIFENFTYIHYFAEHGIGGKAPGVLLNLSLMKKLDLQFPTDAGAKHDKAFFLSANAVGNVAYWPCKVIAKRLHPNRSIHRNVTTNYCLFNKKLSEIYAFDVVALSKVHVKRFERWMQDEPRFRPVDCYRLLSASNLSRYAKTKLFGRYIVYRLPSALLSFVDKRRR